MQPEINSDHFSWSEKDTWIAALKQTKTYAAYVSKLKLSGQKDFDFKGTNQLKNVVVRDYNPRPKLVNSHSANLNGPGAADHVMLAEDLAKMPQLEYLAGMMPFKIGGGRGDGRYVLDSNNGLPLPALLILVDGVAGIDKLNDLAPTQIESVENDLTKREKQILRYLYEGMSNKQIAEILDRSVRTVETHRFHVMKKLNVNNVVELLKKINDDLNLREQILAE